MAGATGHTSSAAVLPTAEAHASRLDFLTRPGFFDWTVIALACFFAAAAYFDAWTYVNTPNGKSILEPWQDAFLHTAWLLFIGYLATVMLINIRQGRPVTRSLPPATGGAWSAACSSRRWCSSTAGRSS